MCAAQLPCKRPLSSQLHCNAIEVALCLDSCVAQYYDMPSPSLRNAVYQEMQADIAPFKVSGLL